jgi:hypothetical protein
MLMNINLFGGGSDALGEEKTLYPKDSRAGRAIRMPAPLRK